MNKHIIPIMVILLLLSSGFVGVSYSIDDIEQSTMPILYDGDILYVGGNGTGNYTKIQDAINDANDSDTVFVYGNSSPYYEHVKVDKSINLIGEDRNTTIIDGSEWIDVVSISADFVNINGFTIQNSGYYKRWDSGIKIQSNYCNISDNFLENDRVGIFLDSSHYSIISNNKFSNCYDSAICIEQSNNNIITNNVIFSCSIPSPTAPTPDGINLDSSSNNTISQNKISIYIDVNTCSNTIENIKRNTILNYISGIQPISSNWFESYSEPSGVSIMIFGGSNNTVSGNYLCSGGSLTLVNTSHTIASGNTMVFSVIGIWHIVNYNTSIIRNNFFKNHSDVLYTIYWDFDLSDDLWDGNYWNRPRLLPKPIFGIKFIKLTENRSIPFPWINFDWHPARKPYDI